MQGIEVVCELCGTEITEERRARMKQLGAAELEALLASLRSERRWV